MACLYKAKTEDTVCVIILVIYFCEIHNASASQPSKLQHSPPIIKLSSYHEPDSIADVEAPEGFALNKQFKNDFVTKNGTDFIVKQHVQDISFVCEASYPITWKFPYLDQLPVHAYARMDSYETRLSTFPSGHESPTDVQFSNEIKISFWTIEFLSLNVTCASVEDSPGVASSIHIFLEAKKYLENNGKTFDLQISQDKSSENTFVIPCRVSLPDVPTILEIQREDNSDVKTNLWQNVNISFMSKEHEYVRYDPKVGYILKRESLLLFHLHRKSSSRLYRCSTAFSEATQDQKNHVFFNITAVDKVANEVLKLPTSTILPFRNLAWDKAAKFSMSVGEFGTTHMICCSGIEGKRPNMSIITCGSTLSCRLVKYFLLSGRPGSENRWHGRGIEEPTDSPNCKTTNAVSSDFSVTCKGSKVDFMGTFIQVFKPLVDGTRLQDKNATVDEKNSLTRYRVPINISITQKMAIFVGKYIKGPDYKSGRTSFLGNRIEDINVKTETPLIEEYNRNHFFAGEPLLFFCVGVKHFFSHGAWLSVTCNNGSQMALPHLTKNDPLYKFDKEVELINNGIMFHGYAPSTHVFAEPIRASLNMDLVNCWMPEPESVRWYRISKKIFVYPSIAPRFLEIETEDIHLPLGEERMNITCTVVEAKPFPQLHVLWDGRPVPLNLNSELIEQKKTKADTEIPTGTESINKTDHLLSVTVHFNKIEHGYQSTIQCIASNANSTVTRTVRVFVVGSASYRTGLVVSIALTSFLLLILVALALKYWRDKRMSAAHLAAS